MPITTHNIVEVLVLGLLVGLCAVSAWLWFRRARSVQMARPKLMSALGAVIFLMLVFGLAAFFNDARRMPEFFVQRINDGALRFGVLALFAFVVNLALLAIFVRRPVPQTAGGVQATDQTRSSSEAGSGAAIAAPEKLPFSWGAAGLPVIWLMFHGRILQGFALLAFAIVCAPFLDEPLPTLLYLAAAYGVVIWLGRSGGKIAWEHHRCSSLDHLVQTERTWNIAGAIFFVVFALANAILVGRSL